MGIRSFFTLRAALGFCALAAVAAFGASFFGSARMLRLMSRALPLALVACAALGLLVAGVRSILMRRLSSALFHLGCACVLAGWLTTRLYERFDATRATGDIALADGEMASSVNGRALPFELEMMKFFVKRGAEGNAIEEYRSRVKVTVPGETPRFEEIKVNAPLFIKGFWIHQSAWGLREEGGVARPYGVLAISRDEGLPLVFAGYALLVAAAFALVGNRRAHSARSDE